MYWRGWDWGRKNAGIQQADPCATQKGYEELAAAEEKEALGGIVCAWIAECGAATGFYFWKAKNENRSKYAMKFVRELADRYGLDGAARILEIVLRE